jgi:hypothetical protein
MYTSTQGSDFSEDAQWVDHISSADPSSEPPEGDGAGAVAGERRASRTQRQAQGKESTGRAGAAVAEGGTEEEVEGDGEDEEGHNHESEGVQMNQERMLDQGAEVFYPNPMWVRKEFLIQYIDPYTDDGRHRHALACLRTRVRVRVLLCACSLACVRACVHARVLFVIVCVRANEKQRLVLYARARCAKTPKPSVNLVTVCATLLHACFGDLTEGGSRGLCAI